ncbi:MAG: SDR family oxidoreductase [Flavobacteriaceae bacterium]
MDLGLAGRTVVITGATGDIGFTCAEGFAAEGARLVLFSRTAETLEDAASRLRDRFGAEAVAVPGDMTSDEDVRRLADIVNDRFGGADVLVLNTGRPPKGLREVLDEDEWDRWDAAHEVQLRGGVRVVAALVPSMIEKKDGRIVAITSASIKHPMPHHGLSTIYRAGLAAYLKHLANEIAETGVTVNMIAPASVGTQTFLANWDPEVRKKLVPMRRLGKPEELASAVLYFASRNAGFITGIHLPVDGGMTASLT